MQQPFAALLGAPGFLGALSLHGCDSRGRVFTAADGVEMLIGMAHDQVVTNLVAHLRRIKELADFRTGAEAGYHRIQPSFDICVAYLDTLRVDDFAQHERMPQGLLSPFTLLLAQVVFGAVCQAIVIVKAKSLLGQVAFKIANHAVDLLMKHDIRIDDVGAGHDLFQYPVAVV